MKNKRDPDIEFNSIHFVYRSTKKKFFWVSKIFAGLKMDETLLFVFWTLLCVFEILLRGTEFACVSKHLYRVLTGALTRPKPTLFGNKVMIFCFIEF